MSRKKLKSYQYGESYTYINDANVRQIRTFQEYMSEWRELSISMFDWKNLPVNPDGQKQLDPWFIEKMLFDRGMIVFFKDPILGYMVTRVSTNSDLDIYDEPVRFTAETNTGYYKMLDQTNGVIIYANPNRISKIGRLELYASRLAQIQTVIDANINVQRFPPLVFTQSERQLTAKNIMQQYYGNEPAIFADIDFDPKQITSVNIGAPLVADKLINVKHEILNEVYTLLGVDNANVDKKERLITDEVKSNNGQIQAQRERMLYMRRRACEKINKMFDLNIWVDLRQSEYEVIYDDATNVYESSTTQQVYDNTEERPAYNGDD